MAERVALVMADSRVPWPPPPSANATARLAWQATTYSHAVAMASLYAQRHCYDLRVYHFLRRRAKRSKKTLKCLRAVREVYELLGRESRVRL